MKHLILLLCLFLSISAESKKAYVVIIGGGTTAMDAEKCLESYKSRKGMSDDYVQVGFPTTMHSDTIEGLNPGFHITVATMCRTKEEAMFFVRILDEEIPNAYIREVWVKTITPHLRFLPTPLVESRVRHFKDSVITEKLHTAPICSVNTAVGYYGRDVGIKRFANFGNLSFHQYYNEEHGDGSRNIYFYIDDVEVWESESSAAQYDNNTVTSDSSNQWCYFIYEKPMAYYDGKRFHVTGEPNFQEGAKAYIYEAKQLKATSDSIECNTLVGDWNGKECFTRTQVHSLDSISLGLSTNQVWIQAKAEAEAINGYASHYKLYYVEPLDLGRAESL